MRHLAPAVQAAADGHGGMVVVVQPRQAGAKLPQQQEMVCDAQQVPARRESVVPHHAQQRIVGRRNRQRYVRDAGSREPSKKVAPVGRDDLAFRIAGGGDGAQQGTRIGVAVAGCQRERGGPAPGRQAAGLAVQLQMPAGRGARFR